NAAACRRFRVRGQRGSELPADEGGSKLPHSKASSVFQIPYSEEDERMATVEADRPAENYRRDFADFSPVVYLNCAYQGPFPRATVARIHESCDLKSHPDRLGESDYFDLPQRVRARLARLVGADAGEIALTNSATQGIGI